MELSKDELDYVEKLAAAAYSPKQIAFMLGKKPSEMHEAMCDDDSDISMAYYKGFFSSELAVRESILLLARNGSSPAQTLANKLFYENRTNLIKAGYPSGAEG